MHTLRIALGSDHAGYPLKQKVAEFLRQRGIDFTDFGAYSTESVDYPEIASQMAEAVCSGTFDRGILVCWTGIGMSIAANKFAGIRAALCRDVDCAELTRSHNDSNVLALSCWKTPPKEACEIVEKWLETDFSGEERHTRRVLEISQLEQRYERGKNP
jgi:ribose 5-phosphate isomerase B